MQKVLGNKICLFNKTGNEKQNIEFVVCVFHLEILF